MPRHAANTLSTRPEARAAATTAAALALMTAVTPPEWAYRRFWWRIGRASFERCRTPRPADTAASSKARAAAAPWGARPRRMVPGEPGRGAAYFSAAKAFAVIASTAPRPEILRTLGALASPEAAHLL